MRRRINYAETMGVAWWTTKGGETVELLPKDVQEKLPPLYWQEEKGWAAIAQVKFFA